MVQDFIRMNLNLFIFLMDTNSVIFNKHKVPWWAGNQMSKLISLHGPNEWCGIDSLALIAFTKVSNRPRRFPALCAHHPCTWFRRRTQRTQIALAAWKCESVSPQTREGSRTGAGWWWGRLLGRLWDHPNGPDTRFIQSGHQVINQSNHGGFIVLKCKEPRCPGQQESRGSTLAIGAYLVCLGAEGLGGAGKVDCATKKVSWKSSESLHSHMFIFININRRKGRYMVSFVNINGIRGLGG